MALSKQSEKRIADALEKVAALIEQGDHPNEAIIKIAGDVQMPAGHVRLMANAVNTGRTNAHRLTHEDPLEKAGDFPVADTKVILNSLFPDKVQTKAAAYLEDIVADEYNKGPKWLSVKQSMEKAARAIDWKLTEKKFVPETDPDRPIKLAIAETQRNHIAMEQQRLKLAMTREAAIKLSDELRTYFKRPTHVPFDEVRENCELLLGKQAGVLLDDLKPAKYVRSRVESTPVNFNAEPYNLVQYLLKVSAAFCHNKTVYEETVKTANASAETLRPFGPGPEAGHSVMEGQSSPMKAEFIKAGDLGSFLARGFGAFSAADLAKEVARRVPGVPGTSKSIEERDLQDLMDPSHENEIRSIQSEALLNDLMANDDVVKGYDPEEVVDAYNEVSQLTPYASGQKAIMRDLLRKRLGGGPQALDQFTTGDTLKTQDTLKGLQAPDTGNLSVLSSFGVTPHGNSPAGGSVMAK